MSGPNAPVWKGLYGLVLQPQNRELQLADRVTDIDVYTGAAEMCYASVLRRGTYGTGDRAGWVCTSCKVNGAKGAKGTLTINWEVGGPAANTAFLPLDDFRSEIVELYPKVERHWSLLGEDYPTVKTAKIGQEAIDLAYQAVRGNDNATRDAAAQTIEGWYLTPPDYAPPEGTTWDNQALWAAQLMEWLQNGIETYYLSGIKASWIWHAFTMPGSITRGGYIEIPTAGPFLGNTEMSWLRLADQVEHVGVAGSCYRITSTWLGAPDGHWDPDLYKKVITP